MTKRVLFLTAFLGFFLGGCLGPVKRPRPIVPPTGAEGVPSPLFPPLEGMEILTAVFAPGPADKPLAVAEFFKSRPHLRVSLLLPSGFFYRRDDPLVSKAKALFGEMVSSRQLEIILTMNGRPVLPLVMDTNNAKMSTAPVTSLPPVFKRPEDVVGMMDEARRQYRKQWKTEPTLLRPPWDIVLGPELTILPKKLKFQGVVLSDKKSPAGIFGGLDVPVVRPAPFPSGHDDARKLWFARWKEETSTSPYSRPLFVSSQADLASLEKIAGSSETVAWTWVSEALAAAGPIPPGGPSLPAPDFTPWIGDPEKNMAWALLGITRDAVDEFQNSGRADVHRLDVALKQIYFAEGGGFFDQLGKNKSADNTEKKREFLATLGQVYRIMGQAPPPSLQRGFTGSMSALANGTGEASFFEKSGDTLTWRDAAGDDRGPGDYFYPTGAEWVPGSWDLKTFSVSSVEGAVKFRFQTASLTNPWKAPAGFSFPLVDLYIDINNLTGAGAENLLPGRPGTVESRDAWEYALTVDGWGAKIYQYVPGSPPRRVAAADSKIVAPHTFEVSVSRNLFRGSPEDWGYGVVVMGKNPAASAADPSSLPVGVKSGPRQFGGAWTGGPSREAPPFLDILTPPDDDQERILGAYKQGGDVVIPFVRAE